MIYYKIIPLNFIPQNFKYKILYHKLHITKFAKLVWQ